VRDLRGTTEESGALASLEQGDLQGFTLTGPIRNRVRDERVTGREAGGRLRQTGQQKMSMCRMFSTGATGLEPATFGVTGRVGRHDARRRTPLNGHICRAFQLRSQARTAWLSQSSNRRLGHEWATKSCRHGQRTGWRTREIACAKTRIVFSFPSHRRCFVRADALALVRARPDASPVTREPEAPV
jgi:hypothetical protein